MVIYIFRLPHPIGPQGPAAMIAYLVVSGAFLNKFVVLLAINQSIDGNEHVAALAFHNVVTNVAYSEVVFHCV